MRKIPYNWKSQIKNININLRIFYVILIMIIIRIGTDIPLPFVNTDYLEIMKDSILSNGLIGAMTGSSFGKLSFFALSITPYITASIIMQLMTIVIPALEELLKSGKTGELKYKKITNIFGIIMALIQSIAMAVGFGRQGLIVPYNTWTILFMSIMWTVGATVLIYIGEFIDNFGIGNGISIILFCNIVSTIPTDVENYYYMFMYEKEIMPKVLYGLLFAVIFFTLVGICTVLTTTRRELKVTYSNKLEGNINKSIIPIPLVTCNVMPIIFAGSIISIPGIIIELTGTKIRIIEAAYHYLTPQMWFNKSSIRYTFGILIYIALTYFFTIFYLQIAFNSVEISENLKKNGAFIPGIRPGAPTEKYLHKIIRNTALLGNTYLTGLIIIMYAITGISGLGSLSMSSTSAIIAVSVLNEIFSKIKGEKLSNKKYIIKENSKDLGFMGTL